MFSQSKLLTTKGKQLPRFGDPDIDKYIANLTSCDKTQANAIGTLINGLKTDGIFSKVTQLCLLGYSSRDSLIDVKLSQNATTVNSPAFIAGDQPSPGHIIQQLPPKYINSNITLTHATYNDNHTVFVTQSAIGGVGDTGVVFGALDGSGTEAVVVLWDGPSSTHQGRTQTGTFTTVVNGDIGFLGLTRNSSTENVLVDINETSLRSDNSADNMPDYNIFIGALNFGGTASDLINGIRIGSFGILTGLSVAELQNLRSRITTYEASL